MRDPNSRNPRQQSIYVPSLQFWERMKVHAAREGLRVSQWLCQVAEKEMARKEKERP
jgi:hypothetical protein